MEFFLDTADVVEIKEIAAEFWMGLLQILPNQKSSRDFKEVVAEIAEICKGPISAEVTAMDAAGMLGHIIER